MQGRQLPLGVALRDAVSFETYVAGPNAEAVAAVRALATRADAGVLLLFGPPGCGKTHLLQAAARAASGLRIPCAYLPLRELPLDHAALDGLDALSLVCVDDVDAIGADRERAQELLRLLDALRARGARILAAAHAAPERAGLALPDLRSRLAAFTVFGLKPLSDDDRLALLRARAAARGLTLPDDAARYLLRRLPRDARNLVEAIDVLDRASLSAQRRLTVPFVQDVLSADSPTPQPLPHEGGGA